MNANVPKKSSSALHPPFLESSSPGPHSAVSSPSDLPRPSNPPPPERRRSTRLSIDDSATIVLVKVASRIAGRIVDISMSGCRISCDQRFPVGIYTRVETEFSIEGLSFRLGGVVQALHSRNTVGIRFLDMSQRKREQLEQLIEEIRELQSRSKCEGPGANAQRVEDSFPEAT